LHDKVTATRVSVPQRIERPKLDDKVIVTRVSVPQNIEQPELDDKVIVTRVSVPQIVQKDITCPAVEHGMQVQIKGEDEHELLDQDQTGVDKDDDLQVNQFRIPNYNETKHKDNEINKKPVETVVPVESVETLEGSGEDIVTNSSSEHHTVKVYPHYLPQKSENNTSQNSTTSDDSKSILPIIYTEIDEASSGMSSEEVKDYLLTIAIFVGIGLLVLVIFSLFVILCIKLFMW
jgi:hypothetical protein